MEKIEEPITEKITAQTFRDQGRKALENSGLSYADFNVFNISLLETILEDELSKHNNLPMKIEKPLKKDFKFKSDGSIAYGYLKVKSSYFIKREAISFNPDGFIGFAGWADKGNVQPFVDAFTRWIDILSPSPKVFTGLVFECLLTDQRIPAHAKIKNSTGIHIEDWTGEIYKSERFGL